MHRGERSSSLPDPPDETMLSLFSEPDDERTDQFDQSVETTNGGTTPDVAQLHPSYHDPAPPRVMDEHTLNRLAEGTLPNGRLYPPVVEYRSRPSSRAVSQGAPSQGTISHRAPSQGAISQGEPSQCTSSEELDFINRQNDPDQTWEKRSEYADSHTWPSERYKQPSETGSASTHRRSRANSMRRSTDALEFNSRAATPSDTTRGNSSDDDYVQDIKRALEKNMFSRTMALSKFRPWFDIIRRNDVTALENVLNSVSTQGRFHLLNIPFHYDTTLEKEYSNCQYCLPSFVAATFAAGEVFMVMYDRGTNLFNHDVSGESILHCICNLSLLRPEREQFYMNLYQLLLKQSDINVWKKLLLSEETDGLRPLELASKLGTFGILKSIIETENIYKFRHIDESLQYDLRDYESWDKTGRRAVSPLRFLLYVQKGDLEKSHCREVLSSGPIAKWIEKKVWDTQLYTCLWLLVRLCMIIAFVVFAAEDRVQYLYKVGLGKNCAPDEEEAEQIKRIHRTLDILLTLATGTILMSDIVEALVNVICGRSRRKLYQRPSQAIKSPYVVQLAWDRTTQAVLLVCMLTYQIIVFYEVKFEVDDDLLRISKTVLHTLFCFLSTFSLLQFLKLFKFMAYFAVVLHKLTSTFMAFGLVSILYYAAFTIAVYYVMGYPCHVRKFRIMSDLFNSERLRADSLDNTDAEIALVYAAFFFIGCVFIISMGVSIIVEACKLAISCDVTPIHILNRLDMAMTIEGRIGWLVLAPCRVSARTVHGIIKI